MARLGTYFKLGSKPNWHYVSHVSYPKAIIIFDVSEGMFYINIFTNTLLATLNKSWRQHPTRHQLYGHLPPITKTIQVRRTRHAGHCWRSKDKLIRDVLLWNSTHGRAKAGWPARTYIQQLWEDTGCCPEDLPRAMNNREEWRERVRDIRATSATWWLATWSGQFLKRATDSFILKNIFLSIDRHK